MYTSDEDEADEEDELLILMMMIRKTLYPLLLEAVSRPRVGERSLKE